MPERKKILFVGAGGPVASKLLPALSKEYDIVGIAGRRGHLREYCAEFYSGNLLTQHRELFTEVFAQNAFDSIIWNSFRYSPSTLLAASYEQLHTELDLGIVLPLECLKMGLNNLQKGGTFILVSSFLAFGQQRLCGPYSLVKSGQIIIANYLALELKAAEIFSKTIAFGTIESTPEQLLVTAFKQAIENKDSTKVLYRVHENTWD